MGQMRCLELGEKRYCGTKGDVYSWESRDTVGQKEMFRVGKADILVTEDEVLELGEQRY